MTDTSSSRTVADASANDRLSELSLHDPSRSRAERKERGRSARKRTSRTDLGEYAPSADRPDPIELLDRQNANRFPDLVPVRWGRMVASPFAFYRGSAALMAYDLAGSADSGLVVQLCGDAHLQNFGLYASPERRLLFDLNDFDETLPGPWEWDVKRLAASLVLASRSTGGSVEDQDAAASACVRAYRLAMAAFAEMSSTEVWYFKVDVDDALPNMVDERRERTAKIADKARKRTTLQALERLTTVVDGRHVIVDDPPIVEHLPDHMDVGDIKAMINEYRSTLADERRYLFDRFHIVDIARKVVGVGSVGTHSWIALAVADSEEDDPLFMQIKEATRSVLETYVGRSTQSNHGQRVVVGQRMMQAASDVFLGWTRNVDGRDFYVRQLRDMKGSIKVETLAQSELASYGERCAGVLARAHARTGDPIAIAGYLGQGEVFDRALTVFAREYADQAERDHAELRKAVDTGRIEAHEGI